MKNILKNVATFTQRENPRKITKIILHCSATPEGHDIAAAQIDQWHRQRGFRKIGYHYVVRLDGSIEAGRDERESGAHCLGHNRSSIGVCYIGGCDAKMKPKDTRTPSQRFSLREIVADIRRRYPLATLHGHYEFSAKACPSFQIKDL